MRLLLDTHIALWLGTAPEKLSTQEREALATMHCPAAVSTVSLWELRLKWDSYHFSGARKGPADPTEVVPGLERAGCTFLSLAVEHTTAALHIAPAHKDPFDLFAARPGRSAKACAF